MPRTARDAAASVRSAWMRFPRVALFAACTIAATAAAAAPALPVVNDVTGLDPTTVEQIVTPHGVADVVEAVRTHAGPICIGGARHSQGGQIATDRCLFLDMRAMNRVLAFDPQARRITVEAGITWRAIQEIIDPRGLSLKVMQSYANFTVGGSLSVNAHGRYVGQGALVGSVVSLDIVLADGSVISASRVQNAEIFSGAIGGYGGLGVIVAATFDLVPDTAIVRVVRQLPVGSYKDYFLAHIRDDPRVVLHNADLYPPRYHELTAVSWLTTDSEVNVPERLAPVHAASARDRFLLSWLSDGPFGKQIRQYLYDPAQYAGRRVEWRNYEASYDAATLEPDPGAPYTHALQEYFVPIAHFDSFVARMAQVLRAADANVLNVSIRHALADHETLLAWAPREMFGFVIYFHQGRQPHERAAADRWTRALIDAALAEGGTYYLPYQLIATREQFLEAYPAAARFFALKERVDPSCKFRNRLWERYDTAPACQGAGAPR
ncbi:MAG TPA: FAD-binding oxidoreductase [Steroidobacteraceae bacterium]|nr:FAD-binding oxidoreductase [Steroidobacteraceae bacterium]